MPHRLERINSLIRQELSEMLQFQVKDPRLGNFITITAVETSADYKHAKIFVSQIGDSEEKEKILSGLASASGFFRSELSKHLKLRTVPDLNFVWDDSIERGDHILRLIDKVSPEK